MSAARHARRLGAVACLAVAGCGHASHPAATHPAKAHLTPLVYIWRNFELTGVPDEMTVYTNSEIRYRNLLHTQTGIKTFSAKLRPAQIATVRRLLAQIDLDRADASSVKPRRSGYRYMIRSHGQVATAADGHLHGPIRRLIRALGAQMDRMQAGSL
jgi:hypothetical protein